MALLLHEVHYPEACREDGPLRYDLNPFFPPVYTPRVTPTPTPDPTPTPSGSSDNVGAMCDDSVQVGMLVMADTSNPSVPYVYPATSDSFKPCLGYVISKATPTSCTVQTDGLVTTAISGLTPGQNYYVGQNGNLMPPPLTGVVFAQLVGQAITSASLYLSNNGQVFRRQVQDDAQAEDPNSSP